MKKILTGISILMAAVVFFGMQAIGGGKARRRMENDRRRRRGQGQGEIVSRHNGGRERRVHGADQEAAAQAPGHQVRQVRRARSRTSP